jgi:DNA-binding NarL/FixJ family response regulator
MRPLTVIVAHPDLEAAVGLAASLQSHFKCIFAVTAGEELREAITHRRANLVIVDLDLVSLGEIALMRREFPSTCFVCTHREATEDMVDSARAAGAEGCWRCSDVRSIVLAAYANAGRWSASA